MRGMADTPDYGKWIEDALAANPRLSKAGLSRHLRHGLDRSRVLKMIDGRRRIQIDEIPDIAAYLGVPPPSLPISTGEPQAPVAPMLGRIAPGIWHESGIEKMQPRSSGRKVPAVIDTRYPASQQGYYEMGIDCPAAHILSGDCLITVPIHAGKGSRAVMGGDMVVAQRTRDGLHQLVLAQAVARAAGTIDLRPMIGGGAEPGLPIAVVIGLYRPVDP